MTKKDRYEKAREAFEALKKQPAIGAQLTETSNFDDSYHFLKNYFDRYFPTFVMYNPDIKLFLEQELQAILERANLKAGVTEYAFVKSRVDSVLDIIENLLDDTEKSFR